MKELVNCRRMERFQFLWKMIKQTYYRQQLHKARNRIAKDEEKARYYKERISQLTQQLEE